MKHPEHARTKDQPATAHRIGPLSEKQPTRPTKTLYASTTAAQMAALETSGSATKLPAARRDGAGTPRKGDVNAVAALHLELALRPGEEHADIARLAVREIQDPGGKPKAGGLQVLCPVVVDHPRTAR